MLTCTTLLMCQAEVRHQSKTQPPAEIEGAECTKNCVFECARPTLCRYRARRGGGMHVKLRLRLMARKLLRRSRLSRVRWCSSVKPNATPNWLSFNSYRVIRWNSHSFHRGSHFAMSLFTLKFWNGLVQHCCVHVMWSNRLFEGWLVVSCLSGWVVEKFFEQLCPMFLTFVFVQGNRMWSPKYVNLSLNPGQPTILPHHHLIHLFLVEGHVRWLKRDVLTY